MYVRMMCSSQQFIEELSRLAVRGKGNSTIMYLTSTIVISRFLQHPQKRSHWNQLIYRSLSKTKSIGNGSDPEIQKGSQSNGYGG